jgi:hypothetical protein
MRVSGCLYYMVLALKQPPKGDTLLCVAARYGDLEALRILMAASMSMQSDTVNTLWRNGAGRG